MPYDYKFNHSAFDLSIYLESFKVNIRYQSWCKQEWQLQLLCSAPWDNTYEKENWYMACF